MNRNNTCCFTGHRPEFITATEAQVYEWLETQVREAVSNEIEIGRASCR